MGNTKSTVVEYGGGTYDLEGFLPAPESEVAVDMLVRLSKYGRVRAFPGDAPEWAKTGEDSDIVAVFDTRATQTAAIVHRQLVGESALQGGKTRREYKLLGYKVIGKGPEAAGKALSEVQAMSRAQLEAQAAAIPGWADATEEEPF